MTYERQSNSGITDVLQGVTLHLKETGSTTLQITSDTSGIADSVKGLVNAFQDAIQDVKTKTAYDNQQTIRPTRHFQCAARPGWRVESAPGDSDQYGTITSLFDLGLEFNAMAPSPSMKRR